MSTDPAVVVSLYNYVPTEYVCALFVVLYSISTLVHLRQSMKYQLWWLLPTAVFAGVAEVLGWIARLLYSKRPDLLMAYEIQLACTIIAPTPLVTANFIILGMVIDQLGSHYSRLPPQLYTLLFSSFDIVCLIIQVGGGATAAAAIGNTQSPDQGGHMMLVGIAAQTVSIVIYVTCAGEFFFRYFTDAPIRKAPQTSGGKPNRKAVIDTRMKVQIIALIFETTCIFIRSVYRTVELANGWSGRIISTKVYFNVMDGAMITLAIYTLNFAHPGVLIVPPMAAVETVEVYVKKESSRTNFSSDYY